MTGGAKSNKPPIGKPWFWITLEMIESDAWRSQNINTKRLIEFLVREHMRHGGAENGLLKAPHHQLELFGIGARYIAEAIAQADGLGLVDVRRNGMRAATTYTLTWLPTHDGEPATDRWRSYRSPALRQLPAPKSRNLPLKGKVGLPLKGKVDGPNLPLKGKADTPKSLPLKGKDLLRSSCRSRSNTLGVSGAGTLPAEADGAPLSRMTRAAVIACIAERPALMKRLSIRHRGDLEQLGDAALVQLAYRAGDHAPEIAEALAEWAYEQSDLDGEVLS